MRKVLPFLGILAIGSLNAQINVLWESRFDGVSNNIDRVADMHVDASGNVYVTGSSYNAASGFDIVTIKYNNAGVQQWASTFNGSGNGSDNASALAVDASGNVYVAGTSFISGTNYDFSVIKYNSSGVQQWQVYNGSTFYDETRDITVDNTGAPIVVGGFQATSSNTNFRTIKLNPASGATTWFQDFSNSTNLDIAIKVTTDASAAVYVTGHSFNTGQDLNFRTIKYNSAGVQQWSTQHNQNSTLNSYDMPIDLVVDGSGQVFVLGTVFNGAATDDDILLIRHNAAGTVSGSLVINGSANGKDNPSSLLLDASGNVFITGKVKGASTAEDFFVAKYNPSFVLQWQDKYNGSGSNYDEAVDMALDGSGTYLYATGYSFLSASNNDYLTIKYNAMTGAKSWVTRFNGPANNSDQARALDVDATGNVYVSGDSKGSGTNLDYSTIKYCQLTTTITVDEDTVCVGEVINFNVTGGSTIVWSPTTDLSCSNCATPSATLMNDICYIVSTQDAIGCIDYDTICVVASPLPGPVITPSGSTSFCIGGDVDLTASGFVDYVWNTGETTSTITADTAGTYQVSVTDASGCQNITSISVTVFDLPIIDAGIDAAHCPGDSSQLNAVGGSTYSWNASPSLSSTTIANPYAFPSVTGTYEYVVEGTDGNGCKNTDTVEVKVYPVPVQPLLLPLPPATNDIIYVANYTSGLSWYQNGVYLPSAGDGQFLDLADTIQPYACAPGSNDYLVMYTDSNGCFSPFSDTLTIDTVYSADCYIGIKENAIVSFFNVYPNPVGNSNLIIELGLKETTRVDLIFIDMTGKMIHNRRLNFVNGMNRETIYMDGFAEGVYQVILRNENGNLVSTRIIKE